MGLKNMLPIIPKFNEWPVKAFIFMERNGALLLQEDRAKRVTRGEATVYEFKSLNRTTKPKSFKNIVIGLKNKHNLFVYSPSAFQYYPMTIEKIKDVIDGRSVENAELRKTDEEDVVFLANEIDKSVDLYRNRKNWEKFYPIIIPFVLFLGAGIFFMLLADSWKTLADQTSQSASMLLQTVESLKGG